MTAKFLPCGRQGVVGAWWELVKHVFRTDAAAAATAAAAVADCCWPVLSVVLLSLSSLNRMPVEPATDAVWMDRWPVEPVGGE